MTLRPQYHFRPDGDHVLIWNVANLLELAKDLPVRKVPLADIRELDETYWFGSEGNTPTVRAIVDHMKLVTDADLNYPIILCAKGRVMDGMHRVAKALMTGQTTIDAVRFEITPPHDFLDVDAEDLDYS